MTTIARSQISRVALVVLMGDNYREKDKGSSTLELLLYLLVTFNTVDHRILLD